VTPSQSAEAVAEAAPASGAEASGPAVRPLDFSQPTKFTNELRRRIGAALGPLGESLAGALEAQLKTEVTIEPGELRESTWAAARAGLAADALAVGVRADTPAHGMMLTAELPFVLQALECLLGGSAAQAPAERHLSEIDWALARGVLDTVVAELSETWSGLGGCALTRGELDTEGDAEIDVPPSEPTLSVSLAGSIDGCASALTLLLPWRAVQPVAAARGAQAGPGAPAVAAALREGLAGAEVLLRAEVGSVQMPAERMLSIEPGTVVALGERSEAGVRLFAEEVSVGRGRPGRSGTRKALKLEAIDEQPERAATYAQLGRAELERARAHLGSDGYGSTFDDDASPAILRSIFVRVWAELGRTHMALGRALDLAPGALVELDQAAERPVELFANGLCFASGSLVVGADGGWGVAVEHLM
jgi:flagellar motor switch protein FliM